MNAKLAKNIMIVAAAILLALIFFWLGDSPQKILGVDRTKNTNALNVPFAVANNASTQHFNIEGQLAYTFVAQKLEHYKTEQETKKTGASASHFTLAYSPNITIYHEGKPWLIEADNGKLQADGQAIEFWDNVVIKQSDAQGGVTRLLTQRLKIFPHEKTAQTQETVTIESPRGKMTGTGMKANFANRKITLLSDVRGLHAPI